MAATTEAAEAETTAPETPEKTTQETPETTAQTSASPGEAPKRRKVAAKVPRGTRDFHPVDMRTRNEVLGIITRVYERHGAVQIETPTFELSEVLNGKYGEEGQSLIYNLERKNEAHEKLSLRFDLTVPFARYLATHNVSAMKRYQFGRVFRREETRSSKGRYREFYQCDFDYAGKTAPMVADAECVAIMAEQLTELGLAPFVIKVSNRALLEVLFESCGVPKEQRRTVCSSIDKLDKLPWREVRNEIVERKGAVSSEAADKIGVFANIRGHPREVLKQLREFLGLREGEASCPELDEMSLLAGYLEALGCDGVVQYDMSLARGLDYYTGTVFEAVCTGGDVGSVAGGGRYDNLLGIFRANTTPAVGFALGLERIFDIFGKRAAASGSKGLRPAVDVLVISSEGAVPDKLRLCRELWKAGLRAEMEYSGVANEGPYFAKAAAAGVPYVACISAADAASGRVRVKHLESRTMVTLPLAEVAAHIAKTRHS